MGTGRPKPRYFELFDRGELNPCVLEPRLETVGAQIGEQQFIPDRRGIAEFHTVCEGKATRPVSSCIKAIAQFIRDHDPSSPERITCRVNHLESLRMHWVFGYPLQYIHDLVIWKSISIRVLTLSHSLRHH